MAEPLCDYYRVPEGLLSRISPAKPIGGDGFFRLGTRTMGYGRCAFGVSSNVEQAPLYEALRDGDLSQAAVLAYNAETVIENLRYERYEKSLVPSLERLATHDWVFKAYYFVRDSLPTPIRRCMQRAYIRKGLKRPFPQWPVDFSVDTIHEKLLQLSMEVAGLRRMPFIWFWPDGAPNCLILTHDVETAEGRDFTSKLMDLDESRGLRASFQVIPEKRYEVPNEYVQEIRGRGFEFNIHDLNHDGHLYRERNQFLRRAKKINEYIHRYDAKGFRAGLMYRNLDWYGAYEFSYDMSVPNVAHLDATRGGCCTVFPFFVRRILELPLTTSQDYSIFYILNDHSIDLWKTQVDLISQRNGLMSFLTHPDYLLSARARGAYASLLDYLQQLICRESIWHALPGEVDQWWRTRSQLRLIQRGGNWEVEGRGRERARIAYAVLDGSRLVYEMTDPRPGPAVTPANNQMQSAPSVEASPG